MSSVFLDHALNTWRKKDLSIWLTDLIFNDASKDVILDPLRPVVPQIIDCFDCLKYEARRETLREVVADIIQRWTDNMSRHDHDFQGLAQISYLCFHCNSKSGAYAAYKLLNNPALYTQPIFIEKCADILIDIICLFLNEDDFFSAIENTFYLSCYWRYTPAIFFQTAIVRRARAIELLPYMLQTIDNNQDFFDVNANARRFWEIFSPHETFDLLDRTLNKKSGSLLINLFIKSKSTPITLFQHGEIYEVETRREGYKNSYYLVDTIKGEKIIDRPLSCFDTIHESGFFNIEDKIFHFPKFNSHNNLH